MHGERELGPREGRGIHRRGASHPLCFPSFSKIHKHTEMSSSPLPPCLGTPPLTPNGRHGVSFQMRGSLPLEAWTWLELWGVLRNFWRSSSSFSSPHPPSSPRSSWVTSHLPTSVSFLAGREGQVSGARRELCRVVAKPQCLALSLTSGPGSTFPCDSACPTGGHGLSAH